jgi:hypothetical protein
MPIFQPTCSVRHQPRSQRSRGGSKTTILINNPQAQLENTTRVTFDPLAVAAVLHNPRADVSAARLYTQYDLPSFTWPHTMMMGGTLTPVKMLVEHLTATYSSVHPALSLCARNVQKLEIKSDMIFKELPLSFCNIWLNDALPFSLRTAQETTS